MIEDELSNKIQKNNNKPIFIPSSEDEEDEEAAKAKRFKHLEKEANLRIGYGMVDSENDEEDLEIEEKKHHHHNSNKKKSKHKKSSQVGHHGSRGSDGKLKQTRLIFTPKDNQINLIGRKRQPESSLEQFDDDLDEQ